MSPRDSQNLRFCLLLNASHQTPHFFFLNNVASLTRIHISKCYVTVSTKRTKNQKSPFYLFLVSRDNVTQPTPPDASSCAVLVEQCNTESSNPELSTRGNKISLNVSRNDGWLRCLNKSTESSANEGGLTRLQIGMYSFLFSRTIKSTYPIIITNSNY